MRCTSLLFVVALVFGAVESWGLAVYDLEVEATLFPVGGAVAFPPAWDGPPVGPVMKCPSPTAWAGHSQRVN